MSKQPTGGVAARLINTTILLSIAYAVLRYHVAGDVPWSEFSLFILNKGLCLAGFILLAFNFAFGPVKNLGLAIPGAWLDARKACGMTGFLLVLIHALISFLLFSTPYYGKFFGADGTLTGTASLSMLAGIFGFVFLWAYNLSFQTKLSEDTAFIQFITSRPVLVWALSLGGLHLVLMGYGGWLKPGDWHGGLPPISLVAFIFFCAGYLLNLFGRE